MDTSPLVPPATTGPSVEGDGGRLVRLGLVVAGALLVTALAPLLALVTGAVTIDGVSPYMSASIVHAAVVVAASVVVVVSRRVMSWWLVVAVLVTGVLPVLWLLVGVNGALPMLGAPVLGLVGDGLGVLWPAMLLLAVLVEVRADLPHVARSWTMSALLGAAAGVVGLMTALIFGVLFATQWTGPRAGTWALLMFVQGAAGTAMLGLMLLTAIHAATSAIRTQAAALDPMYVPVTRPAIGALAAAAVAALVLVRFGFLVLGRYM